jgi:multidrug efflux pump subunit AcrA (membrane-fusion protein)
MRTAVIQVHRFIPEVLAGKYEAGAIEFGGVKRKVEPLAAFDRPALASYARVAELRPDEAVELRKVQVGERDGSMWIIAQGLKPGERVIVEGLDKVRAGGKVKPTLAEPGPPAAPSGRGPSS